MQHAQRGGKTVGRKIESERAKKHLSSHKKTNLMAKNGTQSILPPQQHPQGTNADPTANQRPNLTPSLILIQF